MLVYILKSSACLAMLLLFYKLLLEKEDMHVFKRFYLLAAIIASFTIPLIVFTEYVEITPALVETPLNTVEPQVAVVNNAPNDLDVVNVPLLLWSIYFLGVFVFGFKFLKNLIGIIWRIRSNPKFRANRIIQVLLSESIVPHTFFNYVFLNKQKFEAKEIPREVLVHEETHARQKHSLDVLFVELLQVFLWFNPLIYLAKRAIKLNHEFLADRAVIGKNIDASSYQNMLLAFSVSNSHHKSYQPLPIGIGMANAINYSSIKKRFTVMKKRTSKKSMLLRTLFLFPLIAILIYGFSGKNQIYLDESGSSSFEILMTQKDSRLELNCKEGCAWQKLDVNLKNNSRYIIDYYGLVNSIKDAPEEKKQNYFLFTLQKINNEIRLKKIRGTAWIELSFSIHDNETKGFSQTGTIFMPSKKHIDLYDSLAKKYNAIPIEKRVIPLSDLEKLEYIYRSMSSKQRENVQPFPECLPKNQHGASRELMTEYNALAKKYYELPLGTSGFSKEEIKRINYIYSIMSAKQKANAEPFPFPDFAKPTPDKIETSKRKNVQDGASRELMAEYNKLAKHYNNMPRNRMKIKGEDVERLKYIYSLMSDKQKADAEPFPDFPAMPKPPVPPPAPKQIAVEEEVMAPEPTNSPILKNLEKSMKVETEKEAILTPPSPPAPPVPKNPLDLIIEMSKKGAEFYYEGKSISSDKAIELVKHNEDLHILALNSGSKTSLPIVKLSTEPFKVGHNSQVRVVKPIHHIDNAKVPKTVGKKDKILINGLSEKSVTFTKEEVKNLILEAENGRVLEFKIKIPGKPMKTVVGNKLHKNVQEIISNIDSPQVLHIFHLKTTNIHNDVSPIIISMKI